MRSYKHRRFKKTEDSRIEEYTTALKAAFYRNDETVTEEMIEQMKKLREVFKEHERPTIVKSIRLAYEHIQRYDGEFIIQYWDDEEVPPDTPGFDYYIDLIAHCNNKYNRDEIKELNIQLKASLEDEEDEDE